MCVVEILHYQKCVNISTSWSSHTKQRLKKTAPNKLLRKRATKTLDHTLVIHLLSGAVV